MPLQAINILPENSVTIVRGSSKTLEIAITDSEGKAANITGAKVIFTVKADPSDNSPLIQKNSDHSSQAELTLPRLGKARIYISPSDTQNMAAKQYVFDVWVILASGKRYVVIPTSTFEIQQGVTLIPL